MTKEQIRIGRMFIDPEDGKIKERSRSWKEGKIKGSKDQKSCEDEKMERTLQDGRLEAKTLADPLGSGARSCVPTDEPAKAKPCGEDQKMERSCREDEKMERSSERSGEDKKSWEEILEELDDVAENQKQANMLGTVEPEGLNALEDQEWEEVEMAVDSGATETVIGEDILQFLALLEGLACRRGVKYEVANGVRIPNLGEKRFTGITEEGSLRQITAQVCDVNKPLLSVSKMVKAGNRVVFDEDGSYIENVQSGEKVWLKEQGGMYMLKIWVKRGF